MRLPGMPLLRAVAPDFLRRLVLTRPPQICQFCYNNIKTTMNGLCPACRRPYDEKSIEWKVISPEEYAARIPAARAIFTDTAQDG